MSQGNDPIELLVVEDESIVAQDLKMSLDQLGHDVVDTVPTGAEALEIAEETSIDLALMDINLSGDLNGIQTAQQLNEKYSIPVIYLTAHSDSKTVEEAKQTEPFGFLTKPIDDSDLRSTIEIAIHKQQMNLELERREHKYRQLIHTVPEAVFQLQPDGSIDFVSQAIHQFGYEPAELQGDFYPDLVETYPGDLAELYFGNKHRPESPDDQGSHSFSKEFRLTPGTHEEYLQQAPRLEDGSFAVEFHATPLWQQTETSHEFRGTVGVLQNVSRQREVQREMRLKNRSMDSISEGISIADMTQPDEPLIYVNQGFTDMTGYSREEVLGRNCRFLQGPETEEAKVDKIRQALNHNEPCTVEMRNHQKDGTMFWNQLSLTPVPNEEGEVTHYVGIQKDITQRKRQEEELLHAEKLASIGEMAAGIMHEINNPNSFIKGNIEFIQRVTDKLKQKLDPEEDPVFRTFVEEMPSVLEDLREGTNRIDTIVDNVKTFARKKPAEEEQETFNPHPVIEEALELSSYNAPDEVELNLNNELERIPLIRGAPNQLKQILTNLVENAIDASAEEKDPQVDVHLREDTEHGQFILSVRDQGAGMDEATQNKMFDPFYTSKPTGEGTGLGLSIVSGIVERMDGEISVDSEPGAGTTITISIPVFRWNDEA